MATYAASRGTDMIPCPRFEEGGRKEEGMSGALDARIDFRREWLMALKARFVLYVHMCSNPSFARILVLRCWRVDCIISVFEHNIAWGIAI